MHLLLFTKESRPALQGGCRAPPLPVSEVRILGRRWPSSDRRSRAAAWPSKDAKRSGEEAADVLMLRGVLCPLSLSLLTRNSTSFESTQSLAKIQDRYQNAGHVGCKKRKCHPATHMICSSPTSSSARSTTPTQLSPKSVALMWPLAEISRLSGFTSLQPSTASGLSGQRTSPEPHTKRSNSKKFVICQLTCG